MTKLPTHWHSGINLGNSLDAFREGLGGLETETCWDNPRTTREMIDMYARTGRWTPHGWPGCRRLCAGAWRPA